jgi:tRNA dimethylallyltransferase
VSYLVLTAPIPVLKQRISARVSSRLSQGAILELNHLITKYPSNLPAFTACGYRSLLISSDPDNWIRSEFQYARRQLTWFKKYCPENWIDTSLPGWEASSLKLIDNWYNST